MITYKFTLDIGYVDTDHEEEFTVEDMGYDSDDKWNEMSEAEKETELQDYWTDWSNNYIGGGWEIVE